MKTLVQGNSCIKYYYRFISIKLPFEKVKPIIIISIYTSYTAAGVEIIVNDLDHSTFGINYVNYQKLFKFSKKNNFLNIFNCSYTEYYI